MPTLFYPRLSVSFSRRPQLESSRNHSSVIALALFTVLWLDLIRQLSFQWASNEQYSYGWFVPFFAAGLLWRRFATRPTPEPRAPGTWLPICVAVLGALLVPARVIHEANPDWPLCSWVLTLCVVGISSYAVFLAGGPVWVRHFAFPIAFILVAVRWPYRIEHGFTQGLMHAVAAVTVQALSWLDVMAFQRGNLIELSTGVVGINEACSGIRSFQSTLMGAIFLGELYRLIWPLRVGIVVIGALLACGFNVIRTFALTWQASAEGIGAVDKWHNTAGFTIFVLCFVCLWLLAAWFTRTASKRRLKAKACSVSPADQLTLSSFAGLPRRFLWLAGCVSVCLILATEIWYAFHEHTQAPATKWAVSLPVTTPGFQETSILPGVTKSLRYDQSTHGKWSEKDGSEWIVYFFRWNPKSIESVIRARGHRPDICLPAVGFRQVSSSGVEFLDAGPLRLPFQKYTYQADGRFLYVFFCLWQDGDEQQKGMRTLDAADRVQWALNGRRRLGQQTLEIIVTGCDSLTHAEEQVRKRLPELIRLERAPTRSITG